MHRMQENGFLGRVARIAFSLIGWVVLWSVGFVLFPIALVLWLVTLPFDRNLVAQHLFTCWWATLYIWVHPGWRLRIEGRDKLPWKGAAIIVPNHQSQMDALVAFALFRPFKPVSKAAVRWIPIFGWNMMMNRYITLARGERSSVAKMAEDCRYWLRRGVPVMIYPEGTRSPDGEIKEFKNGAFTLAVEENCPVFPLVIDGTRDALPKNSIWFGTSADLRGRVLDPVLPNAHAGGEDTHPRERVAALRNTVRERMIAELARMRGPSTEPACDLAGRTAGSPVTDEGPKGGIRT
jgi:1-acyl-sn-glycerol-3-phosphate acyltransferase